MKLRYSIPLNAALGIAVIAALYLIFLWTTYISDEVTEGRKYGYFIGATKEATFERAVAESQLNPQMYLYINYGPRAGDIIQTELSSLSIGDVAEHDRWLLLYDGNNKFSNSLRLTFKNEKLAEIYRHRQYFELP